MYAETVDGICRDMMEVHGYTIRRCKLPEAWALWPRGRVLLLSDRLTEQEMLAAIGAARAIVAK